MKTWLFQLRSAVWLLFYLTRYTIRALLAKIFIKDRTKRLQYIIENIGISAAPMLRVLGYTVERDGYSPDLFKGKNYLIISNHMSYLDILVLSTIQPCVFVTSVDMGEVPFLGHIADLGGSLFIERRHRGQIERDLSNLANALRDGFNVVVYPEGTSGNGLSILPFKKSLLMSAVQAGVDILPAALAYEEIDGEPFSSKNCDRVCWYGDMNFAAHLIQLLKPNRIKARMRFLEPVRVTPESTRDSLAQECYSKITKAYAEIHAEAQARWQQQQQQSQPGSAASPESSISATTSSGRINVIQS